MESDEFIKSSVDDLVPSLSESEDLSDSKCDVPSYDDFTTFSNLLFDADDDFSPRSDETDYDPGEEIHLIEKLLYDNSSPCPPEEFIFKNFDTKIESFFPSPIPAKDNDSFMEEIDLSFTLDDSIPPSIKEDDYNSEKDMLVFEKLLRNDSLSTPENESFNFDIPSFSRPMEGTLLTWMFYLSIFIPLNQLKYGGNWVKLSDLKQALRGRHLMLILSF
nr:hypothetical protein [Tanacetum cinerariifolium]